MRTTVAKPKSRRRTSVPAKNGKYPWMDCARGMVRIRPGVDLTKPTLPPGKYFT